MIFHTIACASACARRRPGLKPLVAGCLLVCMVPVTVAGEPGRKQPELQQGQDQSAALERDGRRQREEYGALRMAVQGSEQAASRVVDDIKKTKQALEQKIRTTGELDTRIQALQSALQSDRSLLATLVRAVYMGGRFRALLEQQEVARIGRMLAYYDYFDQLRLQRMESITGSLREFDGAQATMQLNLDRLQGLHRRYQKLLDEYIGQRQQRQEAMHQLAGYLADQNRSLTVWQGTAEKLRALIADLQRSAPRPGQRPFQSLQGQLSWPVMGHLGNQFGESRLDGLMVWDGVTLVTGAGEPVQAISAGRVVFADWFHNLGLLVILDHGDGYISLYGHNEQLKSRRGRRVRQGDTIAYVGDSGGQMEFGLYFEIRREGVPLNPAHWCREEPDA